MNISKIIKHIREELALSQDEFAEKVGVDRLAVTRWENNKAVPSRIAQLKVYEIAKENNIDLFGRIILDMPEHKAENNKVILYHGSRAGIEGEIRPVSRELCDFGKGFYMGTQAHQPLTLIWSHPKAAMYVVELDLTDLKVLHIPAGIEWALLIAYSRGKLDGSIGTKLYEKYERILRGYDVIVGKIADDKMFYVLDRFFDLAITDKGLVECLSALQLGEQYVAITKKACRQIRVAEKRVLSDLEKECIGEISEMNRKHGIEHANEICKSHRREGRFFDEILKEGER
jgi:transcriptional regulator with XRE-family HTH domain